ncbi:hypothetical protein [Nocardioides sp. GXZ039]|uniref:hypothetical protein n=1 Tax=Nocardioides sp. GXZ039 TaxID=3136018 RepID=UPI0030F38F26
MSASSLVVAVAVDAGARDVAGAEHLVGLLDEVLPAGAPSYVASTHVVESEDGRRVAVAASWEPDGADETDEAAWLARLLAAVPGAAAVVGARTGGAPAAAGALAAARAHAARTDGRVARFGGQAGIERVLAVGEVVASSLIEEVVALGSPPLPPETVVDLREWARPTWRAGRLVLTVQQSRDGLVPFESRHQIACCADH